MYDKELKADEKRDQPDLQQLREGPRLFTGTLAQAVAPLRFNFGEALNHLRVGNKVGRYKHPGFALQYLKTSIVQTPDDTGQVVTIGISHILVMSGPTMPPTPVSLNTEDIFAVDWVLL